MQLPEWFASIFTFSGIWQHAGWASVMLYLAALTSISPELIEAAVIDGAGRWRRLLHITLPGIAPVVTIMFLLRIGQLLTVDYQMILLLYSPAIYEKADVLGTYIYRRGIVGGASASRPRSVCSRQRSGWCSSWGRTRSPST